VSEKEERKKKRGWVSKRKRKNRKKETERERVMVKGRERYVVREKGERGWGREREKYDPSSLGPKKDLSTNFDLTHILEALRLSA